MFCMYLYGSWEDILGFGWVELWDWNDCQIISSGTFETPGIDNALIENRMGKPSQIFLRCSGEGVGIMF